MPTFELTMLDISMVMAYVVVIVGIGFYVSRYQESTGDYFLAGRSLTWSIIGFSLFASKWNPSHVERELEHMATLPWYKNFFVLSGGLLAMIAVVFVLFW